MLKTTNILILLIFVQTNWIKDIQKSIKNIDKNAIIIKNKTKSDEKNIANYTKYKLNRYIKTKITIKSKAVGLIGFNIQYKVYQSKSSIFYTYVYICEPIFYKNSVDTIRPTFKIIESLKHFKPDSSGVELSRSVYYNKNQNIDSLKLILSNTDFNTGTLSSKDYLEEKQKLTRFKKGFSNFAR